MKVSIITTSFNSENTLRDTIESVLAQSYANIEYIIIDGASSDNTYSIIKEYSERISIIISEKDNGIYDAMNKGINLATGDIIGFLNSDDFFSDQDVIKKIVQQFKNENIEAVYGDVHFVNDQNLSKCVRYYSSRVFKRKLMRFGFMPAHPSFYLRKECFQKFGKFKIDYKIGADFELLLRMIFVNNINISYLNIDAVTMRTGGVSTSGIESHKQIMKDHMKAFKENNIYTNRLLLSMRYVYKIIEIIFSKVKY